jgi:hypothetical protein
MCRTSADYSMLLSPSNLLYFVALFYLLFYVVFRFSLPAHVLYNYWVETLFLAQFQSPLMQVSLLCFVVVVERRLPIPVMVVRISNDNLHATTTCLSYSTIIDEAHDVLASHNWNVVFRFIICFICSAHFTVHIMQLDGPLPLVLILEAFSTLPFSLSFGIRMGKTPIS